MTFSKPYKTSWNDVVTVGPFDVAFDTQRLREQEFSFELTWANPRINIGQFEVHDTLTRIVGGVPLRFHLDGTCANMNLQIPGGQWRIHGKMRWDFASNQFILSWLDFKLAMDARAVPVVDVGQCQGPPDLFAAVKEAVGTISKDQAWLEDVLKTGALDWLQVTLGSLQTQLLTARDLPLKDGMNLGWRPSSLVALPGGLIRVGGELAISKLGAQQGGGMLVRSYDTSALSQVRESGFVMPKDTLQKIVGYMYSNGELQYRTQSKEVESFQTLMKSRFLQFFVWPDLMSFAKSTLFYFDVTTSAEPQLSNGTMLTGGGSAYDFSGPLLVHQWAPGGKTYLPYVDFKSALRGQIFATLKDGDLRLQTRLNKLKLKAVFRAEFSLWRRVSAWISTSLLGSRAQSYIEEKPVTLKVPDWDLEKGMAIGLRDVQAWPDSFRIPVDFKSKP